ncbi:MAG: restriction endonuclease [Bacteroides sp.]|nr:restriction endonuclease [Bacteroides sp.]
MRRDEDIKIGCVIWLIILFYTVLAFSSFFRTSLLWFKGKASISWITGIISIATIIITIRFIYIRRTLLTQNKAVSNELFLSKRTFQEKEKTLVTQKNAIESELKRTKEYADKKDKVYKSFEKRDDSAIKGLTELYSDVCTIQDYHTEIYLRTKSHPAYKKALDIKEIRSEKRVLIEQNRILLYKYELIFKAFPELSRYVDSFEDLKSLLQYKNIENVKENYDYAQDYISKEDYNKLSITERNQLALDKYIIRKKTDWQIGRDYELFCGYWMKNMGFYNIRQFGIEKRLEDMGRDIIADKDGFTYIVQCKIWSQKKEIHENHIAQLYGTTIAYSLESGNPNVKPVFITTTKLSNIAGRFARRLCVDIWEIPFGEFPRIKCNISTSGEKIYHLPFDQQYDKTIINKSGEFYAWTVEEAESKGFRRAFRWNG